MSETRVEVQRGGTVESVHRVHVAVADGSGRIRAYAGNPQWVTFARSAIKPIQALPLVEDGVIERFHIADEELALCCASHSGEQRHVEAAASLLRKLGLGEDALACGPHAPFHAGAAAALRAQGRPPGRLHNNCSGKHAGMLALARAKGWPTAGYHEVGHAVQGRMLEELSRWSEIAADDLALATDGCGVVTFGLPLVALAGAFGRLSREARSPGRPAARVVGAMVRKPEYVGGTGRLCTQLMRAASGRIFAKYGAEGVYCAGVPGAELGIALKVEDGAKRAAEPALIAVLHALGLLGDEEMAELSTFAEPDVRNTRNEVVGGVRAVVALEAN